MCTMKTFRVIRAYEGNKTIQAFDSGKETLCIILDDYNVDGAIRVLEAMGYRLTKRQY